MEPKDWIAALAILTSATVAVVQIISRKSDVVFSKLYDRRLELLQTIYALLVEAKKSTGALTNFSKGNQEFYRIDKLIRANGSFSAKPVEGLTSNDRVAHAEVKTGIKENIKSTRALLQAFNGRYSALEKIFLENRPLLGESLCDSLYQLINKASRLEEITKNQLTILKIKSDQSENLDEVIQSMKDVHADCESIMKTIERSIREGVERGVLK